MLGVSWTALRWLRKHRCCTATGSSGEIITSSGWIVPEAQQVMLIMDIVDWILWDRWVIFVCACDYLCSQRSTVNLRRRHRISITPLHGKNLCLTSCRTTLYKEPSPDSRSSMRKINRYAWGQMMFDENL